jgi:hypothetical protein
MPLDLDRLMSGDAHAVGCAKYSKNQLPEAEIIIVARPAGSRTARRRNDDVGSGVRPDAKLFDR